MFCHYCRKTAFLHYIKEIRLLQKLDWSLVTDTNGNVWQLMAEVEKHEELLRLPDHPDRVAYYVLLTTDPRVCSNCCFQGLSSVYIDLYWPMSFSLPRLRVFCARASLTHVDMLLHARLLCFRSIREQRDPNICSGITVVCHFLWITPQRTALLLWSVQDPV